MNAPIVVIYTLFKVECCYYLKFIKMYFFYLKLIYYKLVDLGFGMIFLSIK